MLVGAKAASVQLAVPPTLAAGDWSADSEGDGEGSSGDLHDGVRVGSKAGLWVYKPGFPKFAKQSVGKPY